MSITLNGNIGAVYQPDIMQLANVVDADQTVTNSNTLVDVPQLSIPVAANERVLFRATLFYTSTATGDFKYRVDVPDTPTLYRLATEARTSDSTADTNSVIITEADSTALLASGTDGIVQVSGILQNGSTAGTISFQFAQNTAAAGQSAILRAGSFLEYRRF